MRGVWVDDTFEGPHEFRQVPVSRNDQGVVTGCHPQYAPNDVVAVPLEEGTVVVSTRHDMDTLSGKSANDCRV